MTAKDDTVDDDDESVTLTFGALPARVSAGTNPEATVNIADDDDPEVSVTYAQASYTVDEGDPVAITVTLSADPERTVTVPITVTHNNGATGADYTGLPASLNFNAGETEKSFTLSAVQDSVDDDDESVTLAFGPLPARVSAGTNSESTVSIDDDDDPEVTVTYAQASYTVDEGDRVTITVTLSADPERTVTVPIAVTHSNGATAADYTVLPASLTFNTGETAKSFAFNAVQDSVDDDDESVTLAFGALPARVTAGANPEATVNIDDDDDPEVTVTYAQASYTVDEGDTITITVTLSADPERTVTVPITVTHVGGASADDYTGLPASLTFNAGETGRSFTLGAVQDSVDDDDESVTLTFGTLPARVTEGTNSESTVNIDDDDDPEVTVTYAQASYTVDEGDRVTITVTLSADPEGMLTVPIMATHNGGAAGADYTGLPGGLTFNAGETAKSFPFGAVQDTVDDDDESVTLTFGELPARVTAGAIPASTVNIADDDLPEVTVTYEQASYTVAEGSTVTVKVILSAEPERIVTIPITHTNQGTATDADYSGIPANVTFNGSDTEISFTFSAASDDLDDDDESVTLTFGALPTRVSPGTTVKATVGIDDDVPEIEVTYALASYTVDEGDRVTITVTLSADPERSVTVPITVTHNGATDADYTGLPASLTFNAGETETSFQLTAKDDTVDDDDESVTLTFGALPTRVTKGTNPEATVNIDDDDDPEVTVTYAQASYTVDEGDTITITVTLSADPERTVTVPITVTHNGGATDADHTVLPASLTFNAGETGRSFTLGAVQDTIDDDDESVTLAFGPLPARVTAGTPGQSTVSIVDDDVPEITVTYPQASDTVAEGGTITVTVALSADPERTVTVPITATHNNGATAADYTVLPASLTFNAGETEKSFPFGAVQDSVDDDDESVSLTFGTLPARVTEGTNSESTVSIDDDDDPEVTVTYAQASYTVDEGDPVTITVTLSADPERTVTVPITVTHNNGATGADYTGLPASLNFNAGETEKSFTLSAVQDTVDDDDESVTLTFGALPARVSAGTNSESTVGITDDDLPEVSVTYEQASYTVAEGSTVTVKVILSAEPERTVTIPITHTNQGTATDVDYSGIPANVTFNGNDTEISFTFSAALDDLDDDDESVKLAFGALPARVSPGTTVESTVNISDDDVPEVTVTYAQASYTVDEGDPVTITVTLSADPERTVTIPITVTHNGAAVDDYMGLPARLTFNAGETEKSFALNAVQDTVDDDGESVTLSFGTLPTAVFAGTPREATLSINDDDLPSVTVSFDAVTHRAAEGGEPAQVKVILSADPEGMVTIPISVTYNGGATEDDHGGVPPGVTFDSGETEKSFTLTAIDDTVDDDGESLTLRFGTLPERVATGSPNLTMIGLDDNDFPAVTVNYEQPGYTVAEDSSVTVKVALSAQPERPLTIPISHTNQNGATDADYSGVPASLTFNDSETEQTFTFSAASDNLDDDGESVVLGFGALPALVAAGDTKNTTVTITDDDVPTVSVTFEQAAYSVPEGGSVTVKVFLSADPERTVTIPISRTNQNRATGNDYSGVPASVTFNSGEAERSFSFRATQDSLDDDGESVKLAFGALPTGVSAGAVSELTVTIADDDAPAVIRPEPVRETTNNNTSNVTVSFERTAYTVTEGNDITVKIKLNEAPGRRLTIRLKQIPQDGATGADYSGVPASVSFDGGDVEKSFTFSATADGLDEDDESIILAFDALPAGVSPGNNPISWVSITDANVPSVTLSFDRAGFTVSEGGSVEINVILNAAPERTLTIPLTWTLQGGATGADFSGVPESVSFDGDEIEKSFTFTATSDMLDDDGESVTLAFGALPDGVSAGDYAFFTVYITDEDVPSVSVSFDRAAFAVAEGGNVEINVILNAAPERTLTIPLTWTLQGGATGADFSGVPASVSFNSDEIEKSFTFAATSDGLDDDGESVVLGFGDLPDNLTPGHPQTATVDLLENETASPKITVSFDEPNYVAMEGGSPVTVAVNIDSDVEDPVTVPIDLAHGNGASSDDYAGIPATITFVHGDRSKSFTVTAVDDGHDDDHESITLGFGALPDILTAGHPQTATVALLDNDGALHQASVSFSAPSYTAKEGGNPAAVTIELNVSANRIFVIPLLLTRNGGATSEDYSGVPETLIFSPGETSKTIAVTATDDGVDDDGETLTLAFGSLPPGVSAGALAETTVNIQDNDDKQPESVQQDKARDSPPASVPAGNASPLVTVSFKTPLYTPTEGAGPVPVTLLLDRDPGRSLSIPLNVSLVNGASPYDYSGLPSAITFNGGETEKTFFLTATDDDEDDDEEGLVLTFGQLPQRVVAGNPDAATIYLFDNDLHLLQVSFGASNYTATEGGRPAHVTVKLNFSSRRTVTIPISVAHLGSAGPDDYSGIPESLTFYGGETEKSFIVTAANDGKDDDNESVALSFGALPADLSALGPDTAVVNLIDNEAREMLVSASLDTRTYLTMGTGNSSADTVSFRENTASAAGIHVNSESKRD